MNRKVLLLQNPGEEGVNLVPTVGFALKRYKRFFMSEVGGCWKEDEIIEIEGNYTDEGEYTAVNSELAEMTKCDYSIVVFVGHGDAFKGYDEIQLSKGKTLPVSTLMYHPITRNILNRTIFIDACRSFVAPSETQILLENAGYKGGGQLNWTNCRDYYDILVATPEPRLELIQSTQPGQKAYGTQYGTAFTDTLFEVLDRHSKIWSTIALGQPDGKICQTVNTVYQLIENIMKGYNQHPQYRHWGYEGSFPLYSVKR